MEEQPVFVKEVLHKDESATKRQKEFYWNMFGVRLPDGLNRKEASDLIAKACKENKVKPKI